MRGPAMIDSIFAALFVALWTLLGAMATLASGQAVWRGGMVGGLFALLLVAAYWADRWERKRRDAAGRA